MRGIEELRKEIDALDERLTEILAQRQRIVKEIGLYKRARGLPALDEKRKKEVLEKFKKRAEAAGLEQKFAEELYELIHRYAVKLEEEIK
ncbi:MAG: chorismate mutase [Elusimicrobium sp.]|jgi:chorismate mutase|nr:chorismate mutase [Elusimicrobium sp.]